MKKQNINQEQQVNMLALKIENNIKKDIIDKDLDLQDLLGGLVHPFCGVDCAALHSGADDSAEKVIASLIIHFSNTKNLKQLPEEVRQETTNVLYHLYNTMLQISEHGNFFFELSNLYELKDWQSLEKERKEEFISWYGDVK